MARRLEFVKPMTDEERVDAMLERTKKYSPKIAQQRIDTSAQGSQESPNEAFFENMSKIRKEVRKGKMSEIRNKVRQTP
jgi:hypothetical protein